MPRQNEFCDHVVDLLSPLGEATYRFMFGGYGLYLDGLMIAIVAGDRLLLRADAESRQDYERRGIGPFRPYEGKDHTMPFYEVPAEVLDDPDELLEWARKAQAATLRQQAVKRVKGTRSRKGERRGATPR